jgi:hypothetical protein
MALAREVVFPPVVISSEYVPSGPLVRSKSASSVWGLLAVTSEAVATTCPP